MVKLFSVILLASVFLCGCSQQQDERVHLGQGVGSDSFTTTPLVRPIAYVISDLIGQGLTAVDVTQRTGKGGFLEVFITLKNDSYRTKQFQYKFEWLDAQGAIIDTKTSVWLPYSIGGNATSSIRGIAPRADAASFRVVTRKVN